MLDPNAPHLGGIRATYIRERFSIAMPLLAQTLKKQYNF
jgi:hypothetical protein